MSETSTLVTFVAAGPWVAVVPDPVTALGVPGVVHRPLPAAHRVELVAAPRADDETPALARAVAVLEVVAGKPQRH